MEAEHRTFWIQTTITSEWWIIEESLKNAHVSPPTAAVFIIIRHYQFRVFVNQELT